MKFREIPASPASSLCYPQGYENIKTPDSNKEKNAIVRELHFLQIKDPSRWRSPLYRDEIDKIFNKRTFLEPHVIVICSVIEF